MLILIISSILIGNAAYEAGNITGASLGISAILNSQSINYIPIFIGLIAFIVLYQGDYKVLERSLVFLVLIMSISFFITAIITKPDINALINGVITPKIDSNNLTIILGLIGTNAFPSDHRAIIEAYVCKSSLVTIPKNLLFIFIEFKWNTTTKKLTLLQRPAASEEILLYAYNYRPDEQLLADYLASQWLKDYTLAVCKYMLGEARSKFATIAGPGGGSTLNGDALKAEAQAEMEKLDQDVSMAVAGGVGYGFTIG